MESATHLAEVLRHSIEMLALPHASAPIGKVTVSIGVAAMIPEETQQPAMLVRMADYALYLAKDQGRNRVVRVDEKVGGRNHGG